MGSSMAVLQSGALLPEASITNSNL